MLDCAAIEMLDKLRSNSFHLKIYRYISIKQILVIKPELVVLDLFSGLCLIRSAKKTDLRNQALS